MQNRKLKEVEDLVVTVPFLKTYVKSYMQSCIYRLVYSINDRLKFSSFR